MTLIRSISFCLVLAGGFVAASITLSANVPENASPPVAAQPGDEDFAAIKAIMAEKFPVNWTDLKPSEKLMVSEEHYSRVAAAGLKFYESYPTDLRRWDVVMWLRDMPRLFVRAIKPEYDADPRETNLATDQAAQLVWSRKMAELGAAFKSAPDVSENQRERFQVRESMNGLTALGREGATVTSAAVEAKVAAFTSRYPDSVAVNQIRMHGGFVLETANPAEARAYYEKMVLSPDAKIKTQAEGRLRLLSAKAAPMNLRFTAADGREVDLAKLRGKVVLVDFWATWCAPCKAELPNVVANYNKYHAQGFEVVGITLENPSLAPGDTEETKAAKLLAAKARMLAFTRENTMPWPQYFDGMWWKNEIAIQYSVSSIPAVFLLDQEGKVVSTDARGPKLEEEVKRLLRL